MSIQPISRRDLLKTASCGFGYAAFAGLAAQAATKSSPSPGTGAYRSPMAAKAPHFAPRAKRVIFMFMQGGPSHVDTFDYKPDLQKYGGQKVNYNYKGQKRVADFSPNLAMHQTGIGKLGLKSTTRCWPVRSFATSIKYDETRQSAFKDD